MSYRAPRYVWEELGYGQVYCPNDSGLVLPIPESGWIGAVLLRRGLDSASLTGPGVHSPDLEEDWGDLYP